MIENGVTVDLQKLSTVFLQDEDALVKGMSNGEAVMALFARALGSILDEHQACNYVETILTDYLSKQEYVLTVRRKEGKTPSEILARVKILLLQNDVEAALDELESVDASKQ